MTPFSLPDTDPVAAAVILHNLLSKSLCTLAIAESCTGGKMTSLLAEQPGASAYLRGGVVAYADSAKERLLKLPSDILTEHGAVSSVAASFMAQSLRDILDVDYCLAVTGIAGPTGATADKPIGIVWGALATPHQSSITWLMLLSGTRREIIDKSCFYVLNKLIYNLLPGLDHAGAPLPQSE